jgi:hypothetical protein
MIAQGVNEYCEEMDVKIIKNDLGVWVVEARNEGGYNATQVDLFELLRWVEENKSLLV